MDYVKALIDILSPLRIYNLESGMGAAEIGALGASLNEMCAVFEELERECFVQTAEGYGLVLTEKLLPMAPSSATAEERRAALAALTAVDDGCFTLSDINRQLKGCGVDAAARETEDKYLVEISFPGLRGVPVNIAELAARIDMLLPCHIGTRYVYVYIVWGEAETWFSEWSRIEERGFTWAEFERCAGVS